MTQATKVIFLGTSSFAVPALECLLAHRFDVIRVLTQPPRAAHRGKKITPTAVHRLAADNGLTVSTPSQLNDPTAFEEFKSLKPDFAVVVAYGLIIPPAFLTVPTKGFLNVHPSKLPRWRGAAPIPRTLMAGDASTGVCIVKVVRDLDAGPIYRQRNHEIKPGTIATELSEELALSGGTLLVDVLNGFEQIKPVEQGNEGMCYAHKIVKEETRIDWQSSAEEIYHKIHGLSLSPGAWTMHGNQRIKVLRCDVADGSGAPGRILDDTLSIGCGKGVIIPTHLQREGRSAMNLTEFLRGYQLQKGDQLN